MSTVPSEGRPRSVLHRTACRGWASSPSGRGRVLPMSTVSFGRSPFVRAARFARTVAGLGPAPHLVRWEVQRAAPSVLTFPPAEDGTWQPWRDTLAPFQGAHRASQR